MKYMVVGIGIFLIIFVNSCSNPTFIEDNRRCIKQCFLSNSKIVENERDFSLKSDRIKVALCLKGCKI